MLSAVEEKLTLSQSEVQHVKASVKQYESLVDSYKTQVNRHTGIHTGMHTRCTHIQTLNVLKANMQ